MPYRPELEVVRTVVKQVVERHSNGSAFRSDDTFRPGIVIEQVKELIERADFCVADVSGANANVFWEAGYAHALDKPIIQIGEEAAPLLPFNVRPLRTLSYSLSLLENTVNTKEETPFQKRLEVAVQSIVQDLKSKPRLVGKSYNELQTLAHALQRQSIYTRRREPILGLILRALQKEAENLPNHQWESSDAERLMRSLSKISSSDAQSVFWWLIVYGVLVYNQIDCFQKTGNGWRENLDLVRISERGVALLNQLKNPL